MLCVMMVSVTRVANAFVVPQGCVARSISKVYDSSSSSSNDNEATMSVQERTLRKAGLWEEAQAKKAQAAERARIAEEERQQSFIRNVAVAAMSISLAVGNYFWTYTSSLQMASRENDDVPGRVAPGVDNGPGVMMAKESEESEIGFPQVLPYSQKQQSVPPLQLLAQMTDKSDPISIIGTNGKPTVVDFWAPWCENCKLSAPTMSKIEEEYQGRVNFVMIDVDGTSNARSWAYVKAFGVDAIPHMALVSAEGDVETALIGPVPKTVLEADFNTLIENSKGTSQKKELPYVMLDVFANKPEKRRVSFE